MFLFVMLLIGLPTASWSQSSLQIRKKNTIEVYYPVSHFFDETPTNWTILVPYRKRVQEPDGSRSWKDSYMAPPAIGLSYIRNLSRKASVMISSTGYSMLYYNDNRVPGETIRREFVLFSAGYLHEVMAYRRVRLQVLGAINHRIGGETVHIYYPFPWEPRVEGLTYKDLGFSMGVRGTYEFSRSFLLSVGMKYTHFVYFHDEGIDFFGDHEDPTPSTLTIKWGLGYRF